MSKSSWIAVAVAFVLSVSVTFTIIKFKAPAAKSVGSPLTSLPTPVPSSPAAAADKLYQDESGFSFKYPADLVVADDTPDDGVHYSRLKLKKADGAMLELSIKDVSYDDIDSWIAKELKSSISAGSLDVGKIPAKQFRANGRLITAAVGSKILYRLQSPDTDYWQKIHSQIAASFVEGAVLPESVSGQPSAPDTIYEPEEIIE